MRKTMAIDYRNGYVPACYWTEESCYVLLAILPAIPYIIYVFAEEYIERAIMFLRGH